MVCRITRDNSGKIIKVLDKNGQESAVFNRIAQLPHIENLEQALEVYEEVLKANPEEKTDGFVSNALAAITNIKDKAVKNIKGWMNQLTNVQKNGGIKNVKQELDWIGLEDYLNEWLENENSSKAEERVGYESLPSKLKDFLESEYGRLLNDFDWNSTQDKFIDKDGKYDGKGFSEWVKNHTIEMFNKNRDQLIKEIKEDILLIEEQEIISKKLEAFEELIIPTIGTEIISPALNKLQEAALMDSTLSAGEISKLIKESKGAIDKNGDVIPQSDIFVGNTVSLPAFERFVQENPEYKGVFKDWKRLLDRDTEMLLLEPNSFRSSNTKEQLQYALDQLNTNSTSSKKVISNIPLEVIKQYIKDNQIEIVEVSKGEAVKNESRRLQIENEIINEGYIIEPDIETGEVYLIEEDTEFEPTFEELSPKLKKLVDEYNSTTTTGFYGHKSKPARYSDYTLEGGENYREVLLTLPEAIRDKGSYIKEKKVPAKDRVIRKYNTTNEGSFIDFYTGQKKYYSYQVATENATGKVYSVINGVTKEEDSKETALKKVEDALFKTIPDKTVFIPYVRGIAQATYETKEKAESLIKNLTEDEGYKSSHWDESNILAHVRLNERTLPNGERVLFVEEVQSDWAQDGKKKGFKQSPIDTDLSYIDYRTKLWEKYNVETVEALKGKATLSELSTLSNLWEKEDNTTGEIESGVPNMPYKKTDQWIGMAMRRVYQMASQEGFDRVAWVTGEQSADRYNLSKTISKIRLIDYQSKFPRENKPKKYMLFAYNKEGYDVLSQNVDANEVENYVGKEVAEKLLGEDEQYKEGDEQYNRIVEGQDLKVGGEGMKTFYNSILPKVAKKEAQRFDKQAKVDVVEINQTEEYADYQYSELSDGTFEVEYKGNSQEFETEQEAEKYISENITKNNSKQLSISITDKMKNKLGTSAIPMFSLESGGNKYNSFNEALDNTNEKTIDIVSNGKVLASFPSSVDERTVEGFINSLIVKNIINPNKVVFNGKTYFQTSGESIKDRVISEEYLKEVIGQTLDRDQYEIKDGLVEIKPKNNTVTPEGSIHRTIADSILNLFSSDTRLSDTKIDEKNLKLNLMKILSDMGVSVMSLKQYQDRFKAKSKNIPPSAEALADVVNRVIAFKDGQLTLENLTEEVMHLIVETLPQEQLEQLSELIQNSEEYQEYYEQYKGVYKGDQKLLEKEILGKILKNISLNKVGNKSETFLGRLFEMIKNFFNNLTLSQTQRDQLKQLNNLVEKFVIQQNGNNFNEDSLSNSREIALMYSLSDKISSTKSAIDESLRNIREYKQFTPYKQYLKNQDFDNLNAKNYFGVVNKFIEVSDRMIETTEAAISRSKETNKALSGQNYAILNDLVTKIKAELQDIATELKQPQEHISSKQARKAVEKLEENVSKIERLRSENVDTSDEQINEIVEKLTAQYGELESNYLKENLKKALKGEVADVNLLFSFFGQLHHASNPILNLISNKIWEKTMKTAQGTKTDMANIANYMSDNKIKASALDSLFDSKKGYMKDFYDHKSFETVLSLLDMETFVDKTGQKLNKNEKFQEDRYNVDAILKELSKERNISREELVEKLAKLETYKKLKSQGQLDNISEKLLGEYYRELTEKQAPYEERKMSSEYYEKLEEKYKKLGISGQTITFLKNLSSQRGAVKANSHQEVNGEKRVVFTPEAKNVLNSISKTRKVKKSIFNSMGILKTGLYIDRPSSENSIQLNNGIVVTLDTTGLTENEAQEAIIAFEINKLDLDYINNSEKLSEEDRAAKNVSALANFTDFLTSGNYSKKEIEDLVKTNIDVLISQEFYSSLSGYFLEDPSFIKENQDNLDKVDILKKLYAKKNALISIHRNSTSPFEIDAISESDQLEIRAVTNEINEVLRKVNFPENVSEENQNLGEKTLNEAYKKELQKNNIEENSQDELDFIVEGNHADTTRMGEVLDNFNKLEKGIPLSKAQNRLMEGIYVPGDITQTRLNHLKSKMYAYYTRFAPIGYQSIETRLEKGENILDILNDIQNDPFLEIRVDASFEDASDFNFLNKNFRDDWQGGFKQPKVGRFEDSEFKEQFGMNSEGRPTKNKELYELRRLWLEARTAGLEKMEDTAQNPFKMIQLSKTTTQQLKDIVSNKTGLKEKWSAIVEFLKEMFAYRVDDQAYGVDGFESNKMIPKYYSQELEDPNDLTTDHFYALTQFVTRANERKAKKDVLSDIQALYDGLINSKRNSKSKNLKNTIKMVDNLIDESIYGKVEQWSYGVNIPGVEYTADIAKVIRLFTKFVSLKNLGFNVVVPVTGALTAQTSKIVEQWIGEKVNKDSSKLANKEFGKLWRDATTQSLNINDNSEIFLIGQAFGLYDMSEKARNARYGKLQRTTSKSAMALHTLSNFTVTPRMVLSILYDNRIVGDKIMNRQQFLQEGTREGKDRKMLLAEWKTLEDKNIKQYMKFGKTGFSWKENMPIKDNEYLEGRKIFLTEYIQDTVSNMEGQLPSEIRTMAQRHAVWSLALLHRGYLSIFLQRRLKKRGFNTSSGLIEEGSYRTLGRMVGDFVKSNDKTFLDKLKQLAGNIKPPTKKDGESQEDFDSRILEYELESRNMSRVSKELAALGMLVTAGALLFAMADDDENEDNYGMQLGAYFTTRLLNESATSFSPSIFGDIGGIIESPMVPWETAKQLTNAFDLFDGEEVKNGKYRGLSKRERFLIKNTFASKGIYDLYSAKNIKQTRNTYENYNIENVDIGTLYYNKLLRGMYKE